jgi:hypothetical protein
MLRQKWGMLFLFHFFIIIIIKLEIYKSNIYLLKLELYKVFCLLSRKKKGKSELVIRKFSIQLELCGLIRVRGKRIKREREEREKERKAH